MATAGRKSPKGKRRSAAPRRSLEEQAYLSLKRDILTCEIRPGTILNEVVLCERLDLGRTPVHQAIARLQYDRLLEVIPRKGVLVRPVSIDEYLDLIDVRLINEPEAARLAASHRTTGELEELERILVDLEAAHHAGEQRSVLLWDREFHHAIARASHNLVLSEIIAPTFDRTFRIYSMLHGATAGARPMHQEHRPILDALRERDGERAASLLREHIVIARARTVRDDRPQPAA